MTGVLDKIVSVKRAHIAECKASHLIQDVEDAARNATPVRGFAKALENSVESTGSGLIAEIKKASPSKGLIRRDFDPPALARAYAAGGASCLSVLTDMPFFQGSDSFLSTVRATVNMPVLRKDFMIDPYQIIESRALGADCVLIILAILDDNNAQALAKTARQYGMDTLVEVHDEDEMERALDLNPSLIGINNRNLDTLALDISTTERLAPKAPAQVKLVSESGIYTDTDVTRLQNAGIQRFLVGESLMREQDVTAATIALLGSPKAKAS